MDKYPVAWGLDIGHSSIKAVKLSRVGSTVTVLGYTIEPITVVENGDRDEAVIKAMEAMALREDFGTTPVLAALSGRQVLTRTVNIPTINAKKVDRMVELEARQQIPGNFDEIEWGFHLSPAADGASNDVALFAVKRDLVQELIQKSKKAGINLIGVSVSSLAVYNFVRYDQVFAEDESVIILDVGAENTDLVCYQGESLWMRTLAVSGNDITKAFMKKFRVSFEEAETLKRQTGDSRQADKIIKVIEGSLNELTAEVQRSLGFYKSQNPNAKLENLVISGSTFRLPGLPEYMAERLRYTVNILEDLDKIKVAPGLERDHFLHDLQSLGVAVGLALQATGVSTAKVNLMPNTLQMQRLLDTKRWAAITVMVLLAIAFTVNYFVTSNIIQKNEGHIATISEFTKRTAADTEVSQKVLGEVGPTALKLKAYNSYGAQAGVVQAVFAEVTGVIQSVVTERGPIGDTAKSILEKGDPYLQAAYLKNLSVPEFDVDGAGGPFRPLDSPREVTIEVCIPIPKGVSSAQVIPLIKERLKKIAVPAFMTEMVAGPTLFSDVQAQSERPAEDDYWYLEKEHVDETGTAKPIEENRKFPVIIETFGCTLTGKGNGK
ncbi:MAG: type IV pilus assembly protein PilM [Planctomycetes bacterium]|nr:type IV pilus assembly protein PilM [Planctomycetota bacterium]